MFSILCSPLLQFIILPKTRLFSLSLLSSILFFRVFVQFYKITLYFNPDHQHSGHPKLNKSIFIIFLPMKLLLSRRNNNGYYNSNGQAELQPVSQFDSEFPYSYFPTVAFQNKNSPFSAQIKASSCKRQLLAVVGIFSTPFKIKDMQHGPCPEAVQLNNVMCSQNPTEVCRTTTPSWSSI